jgi:hypothetical protein
MSWLSAHDVRNNFSNLLFWPSGVSCGGALIMNDKALAKGFAMRPLLATATETLTWYEVQPVRRRAELLLGFNGMQDIEESIALEKSLLTAWHNDAGDV